LISPSSVTYKIREQFYHFEPKHQTIEASLPTKIANTFYSLAVREWNLDSNMYRYLWIPLKKMGESLHFLSIKRIAYFIVPFFANIFGPALSGLKNAFNTISTAITNNEEDLKPLFNLFKSVNGFVRDYVGPAIGTVLKTAFNVVGDAIAGVITGVSRLINFFDNVIDKIKDFINLVKNNPLVQGLGDIIGKVFGGGKAAGGPVNAGTTYLVGERGPELFTPSGSGNIIPNHKMGGGGGGISITVNGALDPEGVARQIVTILNNSTYRGTLGSGAFA
jgi:hypothetical protein